MASEQMFGPPCAILFVSPVRPCPDLLLQVDAISAGQAPSSSGIDFSSNETWNRLNADPLLLIKRNEVNKVRAATSNPYLVAQIKQQLRAARESKKGEKKSRKKEKKDKKEKRSKPKIKPVDSMCVHL
jgi:hypothetical protein